MSAGPWVLIPDFDDHSFNLGKCPIMGTIKKSSDPGVFRGPLIDGRGCLDLSYDAVRELIMAAGGLAPEDAERLHAILRDYEKENEELRTQNDWLRGVLDQVKLAKADPAPKKRPIRG